MSGHTPGPWRFTGWDWAGDYLPVGENTRIYGGDIWGGGRPLCGLTTTDLHGKRPEDTATAHLMVVAPEMYEAGGAMAEVLRDLVLGKDVSDARLQDLYDGWLAATEPVNDAEGRE